MAEKPVQRRGLGRGLSALMADLGPDLGRDLGEAATPRMPDVLLPIDRVRPNPDQPRRVFDPEALAELAESIRAKGIIQPLIVRPDPGEPGAHQIVAGERRYRAAQAVGLAEVPVLVRDYDDRELLEIAIIENVQRDDLNAIDEGAAYASLMERFGHTQDEVATALGKSRSYVANQLRLLHLPVDVQEMVRDGRLSAGHARPLIGNPDAAALAERIATKRLSVREAEKLARAEEEKRDPDPEKGLPRMRDAKEAELRIVGRELSALLGAEVTIWPGARGRGRMTIAYADMRQLQTLVQLLMADQKDLPGRR